MDDHGRIEQCARTPDRRADHQHGKQITRDLDQAIDRLLDRGEQSVLKKEVVNGNGGTLYCPPTIDKYPIADKSHSRGRMRRIDQLA